jgi:ABC-type branched-subunit amino acid transport system ATPase component
MRTDADTDTDAAGGGLAMRGVYAGYDGGDVLQGVDLTVEAGAITCIVGPNGAGKSTVLRVISGLLRPRLGAVELDGEAIGHLGPPAVLARGVAQVPQSQALFPHMTVRENVLLGGYLIRRDKRLLERRYAAVAELVPLVGEHPRLRAGNLSGGQRRMVEIGRTLMLDPAVVLLDEPSLGLDPRSLSAVTELIKNTGRRGKTILLVEQNVRLGLSIATHGVVMEGGRVRLRATAREILHHPDIASLYLGGSTEEPAARPPSTRPPSARPPSTSVATHDP